MDAEDLRSPVQRMLDQRAEPEGAGRPLSRRARQTQRTLEAYLKAGNRPRWMERLVEIERDVAHERRRLARAHEELREQCGADRELFARRWRELAAAWRFDEVNDLIRQHNDWFPIERQLAMDPRTRDYVPINGRTYRRRALDADWVLEQFPA